MIRQKTCQPLNPGKGIYWWPGGKVSDMNFGKLPKILHLIFEFVPATLIYQLLFQHICPFSAF